MVRNYKSGVNVKRPILIVSLEEAQNRIQDQIINGQQIKNKDEFEIWYTYIRELLKRLIDTDELLVEFDNSYYVTRGFEENLSTCVKEAIVILKSIQSKLELIPESTTMKSYDSPIKPQGNRVFIVHGHNDGIKEAVARLVEKIGLHAIILHEQPDQGKTVVEKFENYSDVAFAIIILTADDRGGVKTKQYKNQRLRARQNVIFEHGFFVAKLGRENVCALYEEEVELPSDLRGVLYKPLDIIGNWKYSLGKEMQAAGLPIDLNKI